MPVFNPLTKKVLIKRGVKKRHLNLLDSKKPFSRAKGIVVLRKNSDAGVKRASAIAARRMLLDKNKLVRLNAIKTLLLLGREEGIIALKKEINQTKDFTTLINLINKSFYSADKNMASELSELIVSDLYPAMYKKKFKLSDKQYNALILMRLF